MSALFLYGTLRETRLLSVVLGQGGRPVGGDATPDDAISIQPATLPDHAVLAVDGQDFPMIVPRSGARARGVLVDGLDTRAFKRLRYYEGGHGYVLVPVSVDVGGQMRRARVFMPQLGRWQGRGA